MSATLRSLRRGRLKARITSTGMGWIGNMIQGTTDSYRVHIDAEIIQGIKPAIGRTVEIEMTPDEAETYGKDLIRFAEDCRFRMERNR